jgi:rhodanese-related sulfurtransferase
MTLILTVAGAVVLLLAISIWMKRMRDRRDLEEHSITPEALHAMMVSHQPVNLFDVRQPLDLLVDSEIIPGAKRIAPKEIIQNPSPISTEVESVVYCTCASEETSRSIAHRAREMNFFKIKFLKGGLAGWKAKGYPVVPYNTPFHLDTEA